VKDFVIMIIFLILAGLIFYYGIEAFVWEGVTAWMPLPEAYKGGEENGN